MTDPGIIVIVVVIISIIIVVVVDAFVFLRKRSGVIEHNGISKYYFHPRHRRVFVFTRWRPGAIKHSGISKYYYHPYHRRVFVFTQRSRGQIITTKNLVLLLPQRNFWNKQKRQTEDSVTENRSHPPKQRWAPERSKSSTREGRRTAVERKSAAGAQHRINSERQPNGYRRFFVC